jgi:hypothetical protein
VVVVVAAAVDVVEVAATVELVDVAGADELVVVAALEPPLHAPATRAAPRAARPSTRILIGV